jgi:hypothetical protein
MISAIHFAPRGIGGTNESVSHQACFRLSNKMATLLFRLASCVENSSFSAISYPYAPLPLQIDPVLLLKYRIRLGILSQIGIVATRYVTVYKKARGLNEKIMLFVLTPAHYILILKK